MAELNWLPIVMKIVNSFNTIYPQLITGFSYGLYRYTSYQYIKP
jgi:hypothetical protein